MQVKVTSNGGLKRYLKKIQKANLSKLDVLNVRMNRLFLGIRLKLLVV